MDLPKGAKAYRTDAMQEDDILVAYPSIPKPPWDINDYAKMHKPRALYRGEVVRKDTPYAYKRDDNGVIHLAIFDSGLRTSPKRYKWGDYTTYEVVMARKGRPGFVSLALPRWYWRLACGSGSKKRHAWDMAGRLGQPVPKKEWDTSTNVCNKCMRVYERGLSIDGDKYWLAPHSWAPDDATNCDTCWNLGVLLSDPLLGSLANDHHNCPDCLGRRTKELLISYQTYVPKVHIRNYDPYRGEYSRACRKLLGRRTVKGTQTEDWRRARPVPRDAAVSCYRCRRSPTGSNRLKLECPECRSPYVIRGDMMTETGEIPPVWNSTCKCAPHPRRLTTRLPSGFRWGGNIDDAIREAINTTDGYIDVPDID